MSESVFKNLIVLVVDDDAMVRNTIADFLRTCGCKEIVEAKDGTQAVEILNKKKVNLIISDWEMPGLSGMELLKTLRMNEKFANVPFVMVTSPISQEQKKILEAATAQVDAYIIKPFRLQVLQERVHAVLTSKTGKNAALVVDDDPDARNSIIEYLKKLGYDPIYEANNGESGFIKLKAHYKEIAFVVSDWEMPGLAGIELLKRVRADNEVATIPFIMATSQSSIERIKLNQALEADVDHYLLKPFRLEDLQDKVQLAVQKAKIQKEIRKELVKGREAVEKGKWQEAEKFFHHILLLDPKHVEAHLGLGTVHAKGQPKKSIEKAIQYYRNAITINPKLEDSYILLAQAFESGMSLDKAIACLREGLVNCVLSEKLHYNLGRVLVRRGLVKDAITEFKKAIDIKPDFEEAVEALKSARGF
ncbi:MAG: response regulator [Bacteriovoracia bacterium]